jgi:hypothetical protein
VALNTRIIDQRKLYDYLVKNAKIFAPEQRMRILETLD